MRRQRKDQQVAQRMEAQEAKLQQRMELERALQEATDARAGGAGATRSAAERARTGHTAADGRLDDMSLELLMEDMSLTDHKTMPDIPRRPGKSNLITSSLVTS